MKSQHITIKDIAKELGVSVSTVSRSLKNHPDISIETKKRVCELAKRLNYTPNPVALSLRTKQSHIVGVIVPNIMSYFFSSIITGIETVAEKHGYSLMLAQSSEQLSKEIIAVENMIKGRVDGILASVSLETNNYCHFQKLIENKVPLVLFDRVANDVDATHITVDDYKGAYDATMHLVQQGCRKVAHFCGPQNVKIFRNRLEGYKQALTENGITVNPQLILEADSLEKGFDATKKLLSSKIEFDAIFAVNDFTAAGAMHILKQAQLQIPQDVAIVGFSDSIIALIVEPNLSSVSQPAFKMGKIAMEHCLMQINSEEKLMAKTIVLPTKLITKESSIKH
ncbi:MAG: LacI family DNA-binding transcriptional regulator [Bacteroidales bacterium]